MGGYRGASRLVQALRTQIDRATQDVDQVELGTIEADGSLKANRFAQPIPSGAYLAIGSVSPGDRVLVLWAGRDAVVSRLGALGATTPADSVAAETGWGLTPNAGTQEAYSRGDHGHGTPANPVPAHEAAVDPHPVYATDADVAAVQADVDAHEGRTDNPHAVTATQAGAAPAVHASQHGSAGADPVSPASIGAADVGHGHAHGGLSGVGTDDHHPKAHAADHATAGADPLAPADIGAALAGHGHAHGDLSSVGLNDHHAQDHAARHHSGGADALAPADIGAADASHNHDASYVNVGGDTMTGALTLSNAWGTTAPYTPAAEARNTVNATGAGAFTKYRTGSGWNVMIGTLQQQWWHAFTDGNGNVKWGYDGSHLKVAGNTVLHDGWFVQVSGRANTTGVSMSVGAWTELVRIDLGNLSSFTSLTLWGIGHIRYRGLSGTWTRGVCGAQVQLSYDNGATWVTGYQNYSEISMNYSEQYVTVPALWISTVNPSSNCLVRLMGVVISGTGVANGDISAEAISLMGQAIRVVP